MPPRKYRDDEQYQEYIDSGAGVTGLEGFGTALGGATTGVTAGAAFGVPGMVAGGLIGAGVGAAQAISARDAAYEAWKRDQELMAELDAVNNLADYQAATAVRTGAQAEGAMLNAKQAAARSGVSGIAGEALAQQAVGAIEQGRMMELATALPAAKQADLMEKQRLIDESFARQDLYAQGANPPDYLKAFGQVAGSAAMMKTIASGGYSHFGEGAQKSNDAMMALGQKTMGYLGATDEYGDPIGAEFRKPAGDPAYAEDMGWADPTLMQQEQYATRPGETRNDLATAYNGADIQFGDISGDTVGVYGPEGNLVQEVSVPQETEQDREAMMLDQQVAQMNADTAMRDAQSMLMKGTVTQTELAAIVQENPAVLQDPLALQEAIYTYKARTIGPAPTPLATPGFAEGMGYSVNYGSMDPVAQSMLISQMVR